MLNSQRFRNATNDAGPSTLLTPTRRPTVERNDVVLSREEWWKNALFHQLVNQHMLQHHHLAIDKLAVSIVRHWCTNHCGRFFQYSPSGVLRQLTIVRTILEQLYDIMHSIMAAWNVDSSLLSTSVALHSARNITPFDPIAPTPDTLEYPPYLSRTSPFNHSLGEICADSPKDPSTLLPFVPQDIFEDFHQPDSLMAPLLSPVKQPQSNTSNLPRRVSLSMKPLVENQEFMENFEFKGIPIKKSYAAVATESSETATALTPICEDNNGTKKRAPSSLPLRKRFRKIASFDKISPKPPASPCATQNTAPCMTDTKAPKICTAAIAVPTRYNAYDVVFAGKAVRDHKGNLLLTQCIQRFTKNKSNVDNTTDIISTMATQMICLWKELSARFLELGKLTSPRGVDNNIGRAPCWVEVEPTVLHLRISTMIQKSFQEQQQQQQHTNVNGRKGAGKSQQQRVPILRVNVDNCVIDHISDCILIETTGDDKIMLSEDDVILGEGNDLVNILGNLKFLHHIDGELLLKFDRAKKMDDKLEYIRNILGSWKKCCTNTPGKRAITRARFFVPIINSASADENGPDVYSCTTDQLTIFLHVFRMLKKQLPPLPISVDDGRGSRDDVYLSEGWTVQRAHKRNGEYHNQVAQGLQAYSISISGTTNQSSFALMETSMSNKVLLDTLGGNVLSNEHFKLFDRQTNTWQPLSFDDARKRTLATLRLKAYFEGKGALIFNFVTVNKKRKSGNGNTVNKKSKLDGHNVKGQHERFKNCASASIVDQTALLQMEDSELQDFAIPETHHVTETPDKFVCRSGAKNPIPSAFQAAFASSAPDLALAMLEEILQSPTASCPEKETALLQANLMSPPSSPTKSFVAKLPNSSHFGVQSMCFMQPVARRHQPKINEMMATRPVPSSFFRRPPAAAWVPPGGIPSHTPPLMPPTSSSSIIPQHRQPFCALSPRPDMMQYQQYQHQQSTPQQHLDARQQFQQQQHMLQQQHDIQQQQQQHLDPSLDENGQVTLWFPFSVPMKKPNGN